MKGQLSLRLVGLLILSLTYSCKFNCPDDIIFHYPSNAIRYYDDHDTIRFYSEELDTIQKFVVCNRTEEHEYEVSLDRCEQETHYYTKYYKCFKDSCNSEENYKIYLYWGAAITFSSIYDNGTIDSYSGNTNDFPNLTLTVMGNTFSNCIFLIHNIDAGDSIIKLLYSNEYGVIQRQYEHATFNLIVEDE